MGAYRTIVAAVASFMLGCLLMYSFVHQKPSGPHVTPRTSLTAPQCVVNASAPAAPAANRSAADLAQEANARIASMLGDANSRYPACLVSSPGADRSNVPFYHMIIAVTSAPSRVDQRAAVRDSWLNTACLLAPRTGSAGGGDDSKRRARSILVRFMIGECADCDDGKWDSQERALSAEQQQHGDIQRLSFPERYRSLADKTVEIFNWAVDNYRFDYLLKIDDDTFMRLDLLYPKLLNRFSYTFSHALDILPEGLADSAPAPADGEAAQAGDKLYIGRVYHNAHIIRDSKHKNFQPLPSEASNGYNDSKQYLPFAAGSGYLLTEPLVRYIAKPAIALRKFANEDVGVGFWLSPVDGLVRVHSEDFEPEANGNICPPATRIFQHPLLFGNARRCLAEVFGLPSTGDPLPHV